MPGNQPGVLGEHKTVPRVTIEESPLDYNPENSTEWVLWKPGDL